MNFTSQMRYNSETGEYEKYYRLKESYRNASGRACTHILLNVGFIHGLRPEEIRDISCGLTYKYEHQPFATRRSRRSTPIIRWWRYGNSASCPTTST